MEIRELTYLAVGLRVLASIIIGGLIGLERGMKNRPAGMRTYMAVCLGSCLVMLTNQYVYQVYGTGDPVRMAAQVVSGIGFLGAGTIVLTGRNQIKGITTAACLWTAACSGLAIGIGFYEGAIIGALAVVFTTSGLSKFDAWLKKRSKYLDIYIEYNGNKGNFSDFLQYAKENGFEIKNIQVSQDEVYQREEGKQKRISYIMSVSSNVKRTHAEMIDVLSSAKGIKYIEEL